MHDHYPLDWLITIERNQRSQSTGTRIEPYLDSFAESFAAENYTAGTVKTYQSILRKVGHAMDVEGISPSALTLDMAEHLGRKVPRKKTGTICPYRLARRFVQHLLDIGVTQPVPLTQAQQARATLLADFETYLARATWRSAWVWRRARGAYRSASPPRRPWCTN